GEVSAGGGHTLANLIALCPTCHALYHRGTIQRESIYAWKQMLVAIGRAFDASAIDQLMFLQGDPQNELLVSGVEKVGVEKVSGTDSGKFTDTLISLRGATPAPSNAAAYRCA